MIELQRLFPQFYDDFKNHRFYYSGCESEKIMDTNSFRLQTKADEKWLTSVDSTNLLPIQLRDELRYNGHQRSILSKKPKLITPAFFKIT